MPTLFLLFLSCVGYHSAAINFEEIPDFETVSSFFTNSSLSFYDGTAFRSCLSHKYVLVFGDSTVTEVVDDFSILLSSMAASNHGKRVLEKFLHDTTHVSPKNEKPTLLSLPNDVKVTYRNFHRNMTISIAPSDTYVHFRFSGHWLLSGNSYGIQTFSEEHFLEEFDWALSHSTRSRTTMKCPSPTTKKEPSKLAPKAVVSNGCAPQTAKSRHSTTKCTPTTKEEPKHTRAVASSADCVPAAQYYTVKQAPDIIILQSVHHDIGRGIELYHKSLGELLQKLKRVVPATRLIWRGTLLLPATANRLPYELAAVNLTRLHNVEYFNTTYWYEYFMASTNNKFSISDFSRDSVHIGSIAKFCDTSRKLTLSSFLTQALIRQICI